MHWTVTASANEPHSSGVVASAYQSLPCFCLAGRCTHTSVSVALNPFAECLLNWHLQAQSASYTFDIAIA